MNKYGKYTEVNEVGMWSGLQHSINEKNPRNF